MVLLYMLDLWMSESAANERERRLDGVSVYARAKENRKRAIYERRRFRQWKRGK